MRGIPCWAGVKKYEDLAGVCKINRLAPSEAMEHPIALTNLLASNTSSMLTASTTMRYA
jgi:hypothetical protein